VIDPFDPAVLEVLLRDDLVAFGDEEAIREAGREELAYAALERAALLRRQGRIPPDLEAALSEPDLVRSALVFVADHALQERLDSFLRSAEGADTFEAIESPERLDEAETLILHRDRLQGVIGEIARRLEPDGESRRTLARVVAGLARMDARWRAGAHEFFGAIPAIRRWKARFDWTRLDPEAYWWWSEIELALARVEATTTLVTPLDAEGGLEQDGDRLTTVLEPESRSAFALAAAPPPEAVLEEVRERYFLPRTAIPETPFAVTIGLREANVLRFTFSSARQAARTRELDSAVVTVEGIGEAVVREGAAEISLVVQGSLEETVAAALRARRTLRRPDGSVIELP
jgi:hypothetical protein